MKDIQSNQKIKQKNQNLDSPLNIQNNAYDYLISSPKKNTMNQKFFPSKENFFGTKLSPVNINIKSYSPGEHSPILNYYGLSPSSQDFNYYSPKKDSIGKINNYNSKKLSPNFNISPSDFFNKNNKIEKENEDNSKTLQEKMERFVKGDISNNMNNSDDEIDEDYEESDNGENFILSFHEDEKKEIEINKQNENNINENNAINKIINLNDNEKKINKNSQDENLVKNIINKSEYKPYIPTLYRNIQTDINSYNIPNNINSYNYPNNNYMNIPQNYNININTIKYMNNFGNQNRTQNQSFYYNGDNYQINTKKDYKKNDYKITGQIPQITQEDIVTTITSNSKIIKRINPNVYLNESVEYLAHNIFPLAQDQAGCRYIQEIIEKDPENTVKYFYKAIIPYLIPLIKDPFGNYLVQKLFPYLTNEDIKNILENIASNIFEVGSNHHGTRVIQNLIMHLNNQELANMFLNIIKPYIIPLLKEMHGIHIVNKFLLKHPEYSDEINKIIIDNCCLLGTHKHGCCFLQKIIESQDNKIKNELIKNLIENCFVLIIDQYGNYVIQSILFLNNNKYCTDIALKLSDNVSYYSKHKYSSNVIEKCFDFCGKKERSILLDKLCKPEVISELILDEHGNYVIQKLLYYADFEKKEEIFKNIRPLIPKIKSTSFGDKLLSRLFTMYPRLNNGNIKSEKNKFQNSWNNNINYGNNNNKKFYNNNGFQNKNNINNNYLNMINSNDTNNERDMNNINYNEKDINNNNVSLNNYYNINNNTFSININSNNNTIQNDEINKINSKDNIENKEKKINGNDNKEHKKKKKKIKKKKKTNTNEINYENVNNTFNKENIE